MGNLADIIGRKVRFASAGWSSDMYSLLFLPLTVDFGHRRRLVRCRSRPHRQFLQLGATHRWSVGPRFWCWCVQRTLRSTAGSKTDAFFWHPYRYCRCYHPSLQSVCLINEREVAVLLTLQWSCQSPSSPPRDFEDGSCASKPS